MEKEVRLERKEDTFGFSVFGGAGTKLPPAVCEVTPGGPADLCRKVGVVMVLNSHMIVTCITHYRCRLEMLLKK